MRYQGSEAYSVRAAEQAWERTSQQSRSSFEVVSGGGLDARARQGVSHEFLARFRAVVLVAAFFLALNLVRVAISAATVSVLQANADLTTRRSSEAETLSPTCASSAPCSRATPASAASRRRTTAWCSPPSA